MTSPARSGKYFGSVFAVDNSDSAANEILTAARSYDNLDRLTAIASTAGGQTVTSHAYQYDAAGRRSQAALADGSRWDYAYDALGQVASGVKRQSSGTAVPGMSFAYAHDSIGNRRTEPSHTSVAYFVTLHR